MTATNSQLPDEFFIFLNQNRFQAQSNWNLTGRLLSAAFMGAFRSLVPVGSVVSRSTAGQSPKTVRANSILQDDPFLIKQYVDGTLDYLPFIPNPSYFGFASLFGVAATSEYQLEYDAEITRRELFPFAPSRLSAIFAFDTKETCQQVSDLYKWPIDQVQRVRLLPHEHSRVLRVNMELVSLARLSYRGDGHLPPEHTRALWQSYWSGADSGSLSVFVNGAHQMVPSGCIWEYLIEGVLEAVPS